MDETLTCELNLEQAKELCLIIRKNNLMFSENLSSFYTEIQNFIYESMTLDEAQTFFNEN